MRYVKIVILTVVFAAVALVISAEDVDAVEVVVVGIGFENIAIGDTVEVHTTFTLEEYDPYFGVTWEFSQLTGYPVVSAGVGMQIGVPSTLPYLFIGMDALSPPTVNESLYQACRDTGFASFTVRMESNSRVEFYNEVHSIPCSVSVAATSVSSIRPPQTSHCGDDNDELDLTTQPEGVVLDTDSFWQSNSRIVTFAAAPNYVLKDSGVHHFTDAGPCKTDPPIPPVHNTVCGLDNDELLLDTNQPENVIVASDGEWINGTWKITFSAKENYKLPDGSITDYIFTDSGPCVSEPPIPPMVTEVCGPDNDVVQVPDQPANVVVDSDGEWTDGKWNVTFSAAEHYLLPDDATAVYNLEDAATPCPTDAPVPPVQTAICGPNNDTVTIPPQPDGVTLESDSEWADNSRSIVFAVAPDFVTDGETEFTLTDANEDCPPELVSLSVLLQPSDDGSVEGAGWQLFAPVAAQDFGTDPYAEGVVGEGNSFVIDGLIAGQYRLVVNADGYEPIDTVIAVTDEEPVQEITIALTAMQPAATPTVAPTAAPTKAVVDALPQTGAGSGGGFGFAAVASLMVGMMLMVLDVRKTVRV